MDPRNFLSLAVLLGSLRAGLGDEFTPELFFNTDVTSLLLSDKAEAVYLPDQMSKALREKRLSACKTQDRSFQNRSISLMTTCSAAGDLLCTIAIVTDSNITALETVKVCSSHHHV